MGKYWSTSGSHHLTVPHCIILHVICLLLSLSLSLLLSFFLTHFSLAAAIERVSDEPLRRVINELGGWPVTDPEAWAEAEASGRVPSLERVVGVIKRNFTIGVLIEEWIGPDDKNSKKHIIQVKEI